MTRHRRNAANFRERMVLFRRAKRAYFHGQSKTPMKTNDQMFFAFPVDPRLEARAMLLESISRVFIWVADAPTLEERGVRASVVLFCVRPDLIPEQTMEALGDLAGVTFQTVFKLAEDFRFATGLES